MKTPNQIPRHPARLYQRLPHIEAIPILVDPENNVLAEGHLGDSHQDVFRTALATAEHDRARIRLIDALANDAQHKFSLTTVNGKPIFDENGVRIIVNRIEAGQIADATGQRSRQHQGAPLHTQQLRHWHARAKPVSVTGPGSRRRK